MRPRGKIDRCCVLPWIAVGPLFLFLQKGTLVTFIFSLRRHHPRFQAYGVLPWIAVVPLCFLRRHYQDFRVMVFCHGSLWGPCVPMQKNMLVRFILPLCWLHQDFGVMVICHRSLWGPCVLLQEGMVVRFILPLRLPTKTLELWCFAMVAVGPLCSSAEGHVG